MGSFWDDFGIILDSFWDHSLTLRVVAVDPNILEPRVVVTGTRQSREQGNPVQRGHEQSRILATAAATTTAAAAAAATAAAAAAAAAADGASRRPRTALRAVGSRRGFGAWFRERLLQTL